MMKMMVMMIPQIEENFMHLLTHSRIIRNGQIKATLCRATIHIQDAGFVHITIVQIAAPTNYSFHKNYLNSRPLCSMPQS